MMYTLLARRSARQTRSNYTFPLLLLTAFVSVSLFGLPLAVRLLYLCLSVSVSVSVCMCGLCCQTCRAQFPGGEWSQLLGKVEVHADTHIHSRSCGCIVCLCVVFCCALCVVLCCVVLCCVVLSCRSVSVGCPSMPSLDSVTSQSLAL